MDDEDVHVIRFILNSPMLAQATATLTWIAGGYYAGLVRTKHPSSPHPELG